MDKEKVLESTRDLKIFFEKKKLKISETKEIMFRLLDYIDSHYDEDQRDVPFKNGNGINGKLYKDNIPMKAMKGIRLEVK